MNRTRIVTTHDFFGCFAPLRTSSGIFGGGFRLRAAIDAMRSQGPTVWVDTGDLVQGGPLSLPTHGKGGVLAASQLGVDVSVVGNHEFDFGIPFFQNSLARLGFPVLGANAGIDLGATTIIPASGGDVGVIGITHHNLEAMGSWSITPNREMPHQSADEEAINISVLAHELRCQGASIVVAALHDGVDWCFDQNRNFTVTADRLAQKCRAWSNAVDLIVCGHTLGRFSGTICGTPVIQPWPMGCEIGIVEFNGDRDVKLSFQTVGGAVPHSQRWNGYGAEIIDAASSNDLGLLSQPLFSQANGTSSLALFTAKAIGQISEADVAIAYSTYSQPVADGHFAFLDRGRVTELDVLQLVPYSDFTIVETEVSGAEWANISTLFAPRPQARSTIWSAVQKRRHTKDSIALATTNGGAAKVLSNLAGRNLEWRANGASLIDGLKHLLQRPDSSFHGYVPERADRG